MWKPCKLTKKTALTLIQRVIPMSPKLISGPTGNNGAVIFSAPVGPEGLEIKVENDWFTRNGCIKLTISDNSGGNCLTIDPAKFRVYVGAERFNEFFRLTA